MPPVVARCDVDRKARSNLARPARGRMAHETRARWLSPGFDTRGAGMLLRRRVGSSLATRCEQWTQYWWGF